MAGALVEQFGPNHGIELELAPSDGGRFEVDLDGRRVFSKQALGRHAEPGEVEALIAAALDA